MTDVPERDRGLLGLVDRIMRRSETPDAAAPAATPDPEMRDGLDPVMVEAPAPMSLEPEVAIETTRTLSRSELADVIMRTLLAIKGCPQQGFEVTVYGSRPWNAMLRITPAAGPMPDASAWRARIQDMVLLLRDQYELTD